MSFVQKTICASFAATVLLMIVVAVYSDNHRKDQHLKAEVSVMKDQLARSQAGDLVVFTNGTIRAIQKISQGMIAIRCLRDVGPMTGSQANVAAWTAEIIHMSDRERYLHACEQLVKQGIIVDRDTVADK